MSKAVSIAKEQVFSAVKNAMQKAMDAGVLMNAVIPNFTVERPADRTHGEFATNAAMVGAKAFRMPPFKIAQAITENLDLSETLVERFETAGPGFINFFVATDMLLAKKNPQWIPVNSSNANITFGLGVPIGPKGARHSLQACDK